MILKIKKHLEKFKLTNSTIQLTWNAWSSQFLARIFLEKQTLNMIMVCKLKMRIVEQIQELVNSFHEAIFRVFVHQNRH